MPRIWKVFSGNYLFDLNGTPIGSYEEASALFAGNLPRDWNSYRKLRYDTLPGFRRSKRRLVNARDMGSNVSRHSGKGLSGRRAQSSGSLYRMIAPRVGKVFNPCADGVKQKDRNKFCGSLPNHLDGKNVASGDTSPESLYQPIYNYNIENLEQGKADDLGIFFRGTQDPGGGDQGYGSEWSPDDELPSSLASEATLQQYSVVRRNSEVAFITKENTFEAKLEKGSRGLGLSVTGGIDSDDEYPGLIRIKRIFPHQPAWECGSLESGDVILEANGIPLTGLTNYEALEVLRTTPNIVVLRLCRPPSNAISKVCTTAGEPPTPPKRDSARVVFLSSQHSNSTNKLPLPSAEPYGEFDLILNKVNGSLGFTLRKEDESVLGHYVRALVREPAISDGRIRPGDKIVSVNGVDISPMSHAEAVAFLRQCGDEVRLRLYRDIAQTPITALSPTESHKAFRPRPALRKEAVDMLCTLAVKKLNPYDSNASSYRSRLRSSSPGASPRRRKLTKTPIEAEVSGSEQEEWNSLEVGDEEASEESAEVGNHDGDVDEEFPYENDRAEPASMPPLPSSTSEFSHNNPVYQSAHPAIYVEDTAKDRRPDQDTTDAAFEIREGSQGLLKWKGVVFDSEATDSKSGQVLTVELCRGWNSRLGFSLRSSESKTLISAIYPDSVAAKDGRLRSGDEVVMINDEPTKGMSTSDVIDLLRMIRGTIAITVIRSRNVES